NTPRTLIPLRPNLGVLHEVIPEDETPELINEFLNVDKRVPTIYDHERMKPRICLPSRTRKELYGKSSSVGKQAGGFILSKSRCSSILWIVEVVRVTTKQKYGLNFMQQIIVRRENDKPDSFSEADLFLNNKVNYRKNKLLNSLLTVIKNEPSIGLIDLNINEKNRIMDLINISKFCDATLEKVLKEVKLKIFEIEFKTKTPLLGELDLKIMKAYKREIMKHLKHHKQMRRWESFVNGRPILQSMK
ncbi:hypothetical protein Tco_1360817, partial [Tanacetum coccineum]